MTSSSRIAEPPLGTWRSGTLARRLLPRWVREYKTADLRQDVTAGLTVAVLLIPQAMAYALLAGLPPVVGLYASFLPLLTYAVFGSHRQLAVGPTAIDSLLVMAGASAVARVGTPEFLLSAALLAGLAGTIQVGMGLMKLGFLVDFLSRPVIGGFTAAATLVIASSQLGPLLGLNLPHSARLHELPKALISGLAHVHFPTLMVGSLSLLMLLLVKRLAPRLPGAILIVVGSTMLAHWVGLAQLGVKVVGDVPNTLPQFSLPRVELALIFRLLPIAGMLALVGFVEAISVAKVVAEKHDHTIDSNREMMALGAANLGSFISNGYPVTGGFARTAVADQAGARTQLTGVIAALGVAATLFWFTPLLYSLPRSTLAALVLVASLGLLSGREPMRLWRIRPTDAVLWLLTFTVTAFIGIGPGIVAGVLASLALFIHRSARPHTAELGRVPGTSAFRSVDNHPDAVVVPGVLIVRMDASLYFANIAFFQDCILDYLGNAKRPIRSVVIDASGLNDLDSSAAAALHQLRRVLDEQDKQLYFANVKQPVASVMQRSGFTDDIGTDHFFLDLPAAMSVLARAPKPTPDKATSLDCAAL